MKEQLSIDGNPINSQQWDEWIARQAKGIKWQPISKLPWIIDPEFDDPDYHQMPRGIALRHKNGEIVFVGDQIAGHRTAGCSCCSTYWDDFISNFTGWNFIWTLFKQR